MKKNGFTLVELLAVIVILAIIALIAVPIFLGMINNSKKSSDKEAVNLYTDTVEKAIQKKQLNNPNFQPDKCTIQSDGNLECFSGTTSLGTVKVSMKGTKPTSGTIYIGEDDITYENIVLNGKIYYEKETPSFSIGDTIKYKGADWYVIEDSPSSQDYVTLLKETVLTNEELGTYAYDNTSNTVVFSTNNSNLYESSNVEATLEAYMILKQMQDELKPVDLNETSYKIRLIAAEDLVNNLGYSEEKVLNNSNGRYESVYTEENSPDWLYSGIGENQDSYIEYWTMIPGASATYYSSAEVRVLRSIGNIGASGVSNRGAVRPVINLLKSAIPAQS